MDTSLSGQYLIVGAHSVEDINSGTILSYDVICAGSPVIITLQKSKQTIIVSMWNGKDIEIPSFECFLWQHSSICDSYNNTERQT